MSRLPITFYPDSKDEDIIAMLHADYAVDKQRLEAIEDTLLRAEALSGLELMLADSLRGEMVRQATVLELSPEQGDVVLPKMERLRVMRQAHLKLAEGYEQDSEAPLAERTEPLDADRSRATPRTAVRYPAGQDPIADRFVAVQPDAQNVYASKLEHRSSKVDDAVAFKDADLERLDRLTAEIDSIEMGMNGLPRKEYDKQRREADKLIDERMIIRSDLGQRSAFLSKEEWRTATDSMKVLDKQLSTLGLAPDENLLLMAKGMRAEASTLFDSAAGLRKRADRSEDILERDSLYRSAYAMELSALKEMDRALTVKNYLIGSDFQRGETLAYEQVASKVLGIDAPLYADEQDGERYSTDPSVARTGRISEGTTTARSGTEEATARTIAVSAGVPSKADNEPLTADRTESADGTAPTNAATEDADPVTTEETEVASPTAAETALATERARAEAIDDVERASAQVPAVALDPAVRYERFMTSESAELSSEALDPAHDPELLSIQAKAAGRTSAELEQRSLELADQAAALEDSAVTARKRDREELSMMAVRTRSTSDSLHTASLLKSEEARSLELQRRDAEQAKVLRDRLVKYYYLSPEEQAMVVENADQSRYFQAKARALEQYDMAREAEDAAAINRDLAGTLRAQVENTRSDVAAGRITQAEGEARNEVLTTRSELFQERADSLSNVAARLRGAAGINEGQATVMLQSVPQDRSTEWMALEMRARRTEALLAEARDQAGRQPSPSTTPVAAAADPATSTASEIEAGTSATTSSELPQGATTRPVGTDSSLPLTEVAPMGAVLAVGFPEELVTDIFELKDAGVRSAAPIPIDVRLPQGLVFKVQIGAFRKAIPEETFSDMTPVTGERLDNGIVRYTAGLFTGFEQASDAKDLVRDRGYRDAFVVAYRDGERIPLGVAMREARAERDLAVATSPVPSTSTNDPATSSGDRTDPAGTRPVVREQGGNTVLEPRSSDVPAEPAEPAIISAPVVIPVPVASSASEDPTAKYAATAEAILSEFSAAPEAASYYNGAGAAPARQVETIAGLFFTVQVGVYSKPVPLGRIYNITPLNTERTSTEKIRYTTGMFLDPEAARARKDETVGLGVKDAFVTAYLNGKRIPMQEAAALLEKFGPAILAKP
jgi:hypothetical protein